MVLVSGMELPAPYGVPAVKPLLNNIVKEPLWLVLGTPLHASLAYALISLLPNIAITLKLLPPKITSIYAIGTPQMQHACQETAANLTPQIVSYIPQGILAGAVTMPQMEIANSANMVS